MVEIHNYIGDYLAKRQRGDLAKQFALDCFSMKLQALERTYIDKVFALCDYYLQGKSKRCSRHLYDIYKLTPQIEFNQEFARLVHEVREHRRKMSICPSAQYGINVLDVIEQFCNEAFYKEDYQTITNYFAADFVSYEDAIEQMHKLAASEYFVE